MPSLNGLVDINADSVNSTTIESEEINSKNVDTQTLYVDGLNLGEQVNINAQKLTAITYTATPTPTTDVSSNLNITGKLQIKDTSNPTTSMSVYYDPAYAGFRFLNNSLQGYMYFTVLDPYGNMKNFQFNHSQVYSNIKFYQDNIMNQGFGQAFWQGDANSNLGANFVFVPSTNAWDGWQFINKGIPTLLFYTNFLIYNGYIVS